MFHVSARQVVISCRDNILSLAAVSSGVVGVYCGPSTG